MTRFWNSLNCQRRSLVEHECFYADAEALLLSALGLDKLDLTPRLFCEWMYKDVAAIQRFDAEYYQPGNRSRAKVAKSA